MSNQVEVQKLNFLVAVQTDKFKKLINSYLLDPKQAERFIASVSSAVTVNPELQKCDAGTVLSAALLGEALKLSPSPTLGHYYMVPFEDKKNDRTVATFILGYKGYLQLAMRSGIYKKINVQAVKKGELISYNPFDEEIKLNIIQDELKRETAETTGYYIMFEYNNGFKKTLYWSREKMVQHALRYSKAFGATVAKGKYPGRVPHEDYFSGKYNKADEWVYSSHWYKDFDGMAFKTMIRQLIGKWGIMSVEMQTAFERDNTIETDKGKFEYVDGAEISAAIENNQRIDVRFEDKTESPADESGMSESVLNMSDLE